MGDAGSTTLTAVALTRHFGEWVALSDVSFELAGGQLTSLIGLEPVSKLGRRSAASDQPSF